MVKRENYVIYVDGLGKEHSALVTAINQRGDKCPTCPSLIREQVAFIAGGPCQDAWHKSEAATEPYVTLVYVDENRVESDNLVKIFDVKHISNFARETNVMLPTFQVNCWKKYGETHQMLPKDHPQFDHPHKQSERDQQGRIIPTGRPMFATAVNDHHAAALKAAEGVEAPTNTGAAETVPTAEDLDAVADEQKAAEDTADSQG